MFLKNITSNYIDTRKEKFVFGESNFWGQRFLNLIFRNEKTEEALKQVTQ